MPVHAQSGKVPNLHAACGCKAHRAHASFRTSSWVIGLRG